MSSYIYNLPKISLQNLDKSYLQCLKKLEREVQDIKVSPKDLRAYNKEVYLLLKKFADSYLMPWELWDDLLRLIEKFMFRSDLKYIRALNSYQFFHPRKAAYLSNGLSHDGSNEKILSNPRRSYTKNFNDENISINSYQGWKKCTNALRESLKYPNCDIDEAWDLYEYESCKFPPAKLIETYKKMSMLYPKIKLVEENVVGWFNALLEVGDNQFVVDNVEYRLGKELTNKKLWKLYIKFWSDRDTKVCFVFQFSMSKLPNYGTTMTRKQFCKRFSPL
jgi:hypothetical protein